MKVTTERLEHCQVNVIIELDAAEVDEKLRESARRISRKFNVPGYRRGHAPFAAVVRTFGRAAIQEQALEDFGQDWYDAALKGIQFEPYQPGSLQDVEWDPFRMTVLLPITPEVELGDYRSVRLPFEPAPVTDEQVEARLKELQEANAQWVPVDRPAAMGDTVVLDVTGKVGDEEVIKQEGQELLLKGSETEPLPGYSEQMVSLSAGEDKSFVLDLPDDYEDEDLAGEQVAFTVRLQAVKQKEMLPIDDDLALMIGDYDSLDSLRTALRQQLEAEAADAAQPDYLDKLLQMMADQAVRLDYPPQAIERESDRALSRMERDLEGAGIRLDKYLEMIGTTREAYKADFRPAAEVRLKKRLVLAEVAKREGLGVTEEEIEAEAARLLDRLGEKNEELRQAITSPEGRLSLADDILTTRAQLRIIAIGKGEAPPLPEPAETPAEEAAAEIQAAAETEQQPDAAEPQPGAVVAEPATPPEDAQN